MLPHSRDNMVSLDTKFDRTYNQLSFCARITSATPIPSKTMCSIMLHYYKHREYKRKYDRIALSWLKNAKIPCLKKLYASTSFCFGVNDPVKE